MDVLLHHRAASWGCSPSWCRHVHAPIVEELGLGLAVINKFLPKHSRKPNKGETGLGTSGSGVRGARCPSPHLDTAQAIPTPNSMLGVNTQSGVGVVTGCLVPR